MTRDKDGQAVITQRNGRLSEKKERDVSEIRDFSKEKVSRI